MKKNDLIIIGTGLLIALLVYLIMVIGQRNLATDHLNVEVYVDGELIEVLPLDEEGVFIYETEKGKNVLEIYDHKASIIEATCPDQICVSSSDIFRPNQNIVCLPFRFHVLVQGEGEVEFDAISQ